MEYSCLIIFRLAFERNLSLFQCAFGFRCHISRPLLKTKTKLLRRQSMVLLVRSHKSSWPTVWAQWCCLNCWSCPDYAFLPKCAWAGALQHGLASRPFAPKKEWSITGCSRLSNWQQLKAKRKMRKREGRLRNYCKSKGKETTKRRNKPDILHIRI